MLEIQFQFELKLNLDVSPLENETPMRVSKLSRCRPASTGDNFQRNGKSNSNHGFPCKYEDFTFNSSQALISALSLWLLLTILCYGISEPQYNTNYYS